LTESQARLSVADQVKSPSPALVILKLSLVRDEPKSNDVLERLKDGGPTTIKTFMVALPPFEVIEMLPL
jgi:hypothetical protein